MEKKAQALYRTVAEQTKVPEVANIFNLMAAEEQIHAEYLTMQLTEFGKNQSLTSIDFPVEEANSILNLILGKDLKKKISGAGFEAAAISAAIDMENNAIRVYSERAASATDLNEKALYTWLTSWERGHHKLLHDLDQELREEIWYDNSFWPF